MMLSDTDLRRVLDTGELRVEHPEPLIQPASIDLRLGPEFRVHAPAASAREEYIDPLQPQASEMLLHDVKPGLQFPLPPGTFALASTIESVTLNRVLVGLLAGKSSLARLGLVIESAGWVDPGFHGQLTLELFNQSSRTILLTPGMPIAQLAVARLTVPATHPYGHPSLGSRYQCQAGPTESRSHVVPERST
jgi:dCTP deaminase